MVEEAEGDSAVMCSKQKQGLASPPLPAASPAAGSMPPAGVYPDEFPEEGYEAVVMVLVACEGCARKFSEKALEKHGRVCKKVFGSKRKAFSAAELRAAAIAQDNGAEPTGGGAIFPLISPFFNGFSLVFH